MNRVLKINSTLGKIEYAVISTAVILMAVILIANSVGRTMFHHSFSATEELSQILVLIVTFIGLSNAARWGRHVVMTAIYDSLSLNKKRIVNIITSVITFLFLILLTYLSLRYTIKVLEYGRITSSLAIPMYLVVGIIPLGCLLGAIQYAFITILSITHKDVVYAGSEKIETDEETLTT